MDVVAWIFAGILAAVFLAAGLSKLLTPYEKLTANPSMAWASDFTPAQIKLIASFEVLGAIGVVVPWLTDTAEWLSPVAAVGLAVVMVGAIVTHARRGEKQQVVINVVILAIAVVTAVLRFAQL